MKTKTKNPINFMHPSGVLMPIFLIVPITTFSQYGGSPVGTAINSKANVLMMATNDVSSEVVPYDGLTAKNYVLSVEQLLNKFEESYQSARVSDIATRMEHLTDMNSAYETFRGLKYSADDSLVVELKRLVDSWMEKRMTYIGDKLVRELAYQNEREGRAYSTRAVLALLEAQGNETYIALLDQMIKVKSYYSM
jgi:hypothetical protein